MKENRIDRNSHVPIYLQIREDLLRLIGERKEANALFYSDEELARLYGVNRLTVRRAMEKLVDEGYLYRVRGVGTFTSSPKIRIQATAPFLDSFEEQCRRAGKVCVVRTSRLEKKLPGEQVRGFLGGPAGECLCYLERLRFVDDIPMVLDKFYFPPEVCEGIDGKGCESLKMAEILRQATSMRPANQTIEAEAVAASTEDAGKLNISAGDPLLSRNITIFMEDGSPVVTGKTLNRGDLFKLVVQIPLKSKP